MVKTGVCDKCALSRHKHAKPEGPVKADIAVLAGFPLEVDADSGSFSSPAGVTVKNIMKQVLTAQSRIGKTPSVAYGYSTQCVPERDADGKKYKNKVENLECCMPRVHTWLDTADPRVILALGSDAVKCLGIKATASSLRGGVYSWQLKSGRRVPVVVSWHPAELMLKPGVFSAFERDVQKVVTMAQGRDLAGEVNPRVLREPTDIKAALEEIERAAESEPSRPLGVAFDVETTSVTPHNPEDRVIAVSLSYREGEGIAFPFEHREQPFSPEDFATVKSALAGVLCHKNITLIAHNGKFDEAWLRYRYGIPMNPVSRDTMLAEHLLDEDKKGEYSLKTLTRDRLPGMGRYEDELKEALSKAQEAISAEHAKRVAEYEAAAKEAVMTWWKALSEDDRGSLLGLWLDRGLVPLGDASKLRKIKMIKRNGELVIPKTYTESVVKLVRNVRALGSDAFRGFAGPEPCIPERTIPSEPRHVTFEDVPLDTLLWYAAIDAQTTRMIARVQVEDFHRDTKRVFDALSYERKMFGREIHTRRLDCVYGDIVMPLAGVLSNVEYHGVRLDRDRCADYADRARAKLDELKDALYRQIGYKFSLSSSAPDLAKILFETKKLPVLKTTESGQPSTDADTLKQLADMYDDAVFLRDLLAHRKIEKVLSTYLTPWMSMSARDGKLHCNFLQIGTVTGRLSSSNPNLQNVPFALKELGINLKSLFLPDDGFQLVELDISAAELRMLCAYSRDESLIAAFNQGRDLHCLTGAAISQYTYEDLLANKEDKTTDQYRKRQLAKKVNFGTVYCIGADGLSNQLWAELRIREDAATCQKYLDDFFTAYPGVKTYIDQTKSFASRYGFVPTLTGRRRRFDAARYSKALGNRMARQAVNALIQSTASDLVQYNIIDLYRYLNAEHLGRIMLTVHDSIVFQVPEGHTGLARELDRIIIQNTAERCPWLPVTWKFDAGCGPNYGDAHGEVL